MYPTFYEKNPDYVDGFVFENVKVGYNDSNGAFVECFIESY
jgi:hypothetical protein